MITGLKLPFVPCTCMPGHPLLLMEHFCVCLLPLRVQSAKDRDHGLFEGHLHCYCYQIIIIMADIYAYYVPSPMIGTLYHQMYSQDTTMMWVTVRIPILQR